MSNQSRQAYTSRIRLDVDTPYRGIEIERLQGPLTAEVFEFIDPLVATVVPGPRKTLGILVGQDRAIGLDGGTAGQVLWKGVQSRNAISRKNAERTSEAMSSSPEYCLQVSLSMMFCTSGSISDRGAYKTLFYSWFSVITYDPTYVRRRVCLRWPWSVF